MAKTSTKNSPMKQMIRQSISEMTSKEGEFPTDPGLETDGEIRTGPERFAKDQKTKDEIVIHKLLAPIQSKAGYFMKLKKELRPGEWMLMKTIEHDWRKWADIEAEVAKIVKDHTIKAPQKWGSGPYRIEYGCTSGMRGETYPDIDMHINAEEEYLPVSPAGVVIPQAVSDPAVAVSAQIDTLANLVGMLKNFLPPAADPNKEQERVTQAFNQGLQIKATDSSGNNNMLATVMTGMMGMMTAMMQQKNEPRIINPSEQDGLKGMLETLKTFGVLDQQQVKEKTTIEFIGELKALGMDLFKKDDPIDQIGKLKALANIAGEFMGMGGGGEKPGIFEKLIDTLAPVLPGMIKDAKETFIAAKETQQIAGQNIDRARITTQQPIYNSAQGNTMNGGTGPVLDNNNPQIAQFFAGLYEAVMMNNRTFYPIVYTSLLQDANGQNLLNGIMNGTHTAKELIELLQQYGGDRYRDSEFVMKKLVPYTNGFIIWIRELLKPQKPGVGSGQGKEVKQSSNGQGFDAVCPLCETVYGFENEKAFTEETNKSCEVMNNGVLCPGEIKPMQIAS